MRIALLADIHGNDIAFKAVLNDLQTRNVDRIVCLGDVAATGPQPREVVERLRLLNCPVVMGNADAWLLDPQPDPAGDDTTRIIEDIDRWCAAQLGPELLTYVGSFQLTVTVDLAADRHLLCFHGSPHSYSDIIRAATAADDIDRMLAGTTAPFLAGGHTHERLLRRHGHQTLLNPGSVGLPVDPPWADYAILSIPPDHHAESVEFYRVPFDIEAVFEAAHRSGMPHVAWWVNMWRRAQSSQPTSGRPEYTVRRAGTRRGGIREEG